jgi:hypothetical protein
MLRAIRCYVWFFCIAGILFAVNPLMAQIDRGAIEGRVIDQSGAVVPDATIQVIQVQTNSTLTFITNEEGLYVAPNLPMGTYRLVIHVFEVLNCHHCRSECR